MTREPGSLRSIAAAVLALPLLWAVVARVLASDRGIDLTDESLYLLDADPPNRYDAFGFPYGWVTGPLYRTVGYDIARFRTLGGVVLVLATALLAHQVLRSAAALSGDRASRQAARTVHTLLVGVLAASGLLFYVGLPLLRTPSYNWLNLVGILLMLSGVFLACRPAPSLVSGVTAGAASLVPAASLLAAGAFLAVHAKPTTPFVLAIAAVPLLVRIRGARGALALSGWSVGVGVAFVALAWLSPLWPTDPMTPILRGIQRPSISTGHDPLNAIRLLILSPLELARRALLSQPHWLVGPLLATLSATLLARAPIGPRLTSLPARLLATGIAAIGAVMVLMPGVLVEWIHGGGLGALSDRFMPGRLAWPVEGYLAERAPLIRVVGWSMMGPGAAAHFLKTKLTTTWAHRVAAGLLVMLGLVSMGLLRPVGLGGAGLIVGLAQFGSAWLLLERMVRAGGTVDAIKNGTRSGERWSAIAILVAGMAAYAFGHDTGPVNAMPASAMLGVVALAFLLATAPLAPVRIATSQVIVGGAAVLLAVIVFGISSAWDAPYRTAPIRTQTVPTTFGPNGAQLRLEPELADYLRELTDAAEAAGWEAGQRLYGLNVSWSTGLSYALAAETPPSLQQFLRVGPDGLDRLVFNLQEDDLEGWDGAWLLLPDFALGPEDGIETAELEVAREAVRLLGERVGTVWPDEYELVWTAPDAAPLAPSTRVTLWRPRSH